MKFIRDIIGEKSSGDRSIAGTHLVNAHASEAHLPDVSYDTRDAVSAGLGDGSYDASGPVSAVDMTAQPQNEPDVDPGMSEEVAKFFANSEDPDLFTEEYDFDDEDEDFGESAFDQPEAAALGADAHSGQAAAPDHIAGADPTASVQKREIAAASSNQATSDQTDHLMKEDQMLTGMTSAHYGLRNQASHPAEPTATTAQFTEEPGPVKASDASLHPSVTMRGRPLRHSAPSELRAEAGPFPQPAAQPRAAVEVPQPAVGRGTSRHGRVKTRLLGFNTAIETDADPMLDNDKAGVAPYTSFPVGWLIVVDGPGRGSAFTLFQGVSTIGRGENQTVRLDFGDNSISRAGHASIAYDSRQKGFFIGHGGKANIVRRNDRPVLSTEELAAGDTIMIGETSLRFVPLCGQDFSWDQDTGAGRAYANQG